MRNVACGFRLNVLGSTFQQTFRNVRRLIHLADSRRRSDLPWKSEDFNLRFINISSLSMLMIGEAKLFALSTRNLRRVIIKSLVLLNFFVSKLSGRESPNPILRWRLRQSEELSISDRPFWNSKIFNWNPIAIRTDRLRSEPLIGLQSPSRKASKAADHWRASD